ncbi:hypothetical protein [Treponema sp.]|uniref:hypothetical protein n=1 Tax=Treponema sp. TaxID=166 RepID=UPI00388DA7E8
MSFAHWGLSPFVLLGVSIVGKLTDGLIGWNKIQLIVKISINMMYLVTALFDENTTSYFQQLISEMSAVSGNDFMMTNHIPPHLTLLQVHSRLDFGTIVSVFEDSFASECIEEVVFKAVQSKIPHVFYVSVDINEWLLKINKKLFDSFTSLDRTIVNQLYAPGCFYPHVALVKRLDDLQRKGLQDFLKFISLPDSGKIVRIELTEGNPPNKLCEVILPRRNQ